MMKKFVEIESIKGTKRYKAGTVIKAEVDSDGVVIDRYLRRRLKDSAIDGFFKIKEPKKQSSKQSEE